MTFFLVILGTMFGLDLLWWWLASRVTRRRWCRVALAVFALGQLLALGYLVWGRLSEGNWDRILPKPVVAAIFLWHFLGAPLFVGLGILFLLGFAVAAVVRFSKRRAIAQTVPSGEERAISRREFLGAAAAVVPPLYTLGLTGIALRQLEHFRIRRFVLPIKDLPPALEGTTIAHVSDMHVGRFTSGRVLHKMVQSVNELKADLVLLTGDLINDALADLDQGLELVRAMESRCGSYLIEGNHDLIESPQRFEEQVRASGIPFLLDQSTVVEVNGTPVQLLGLSWTRAREQRDVAIGRAVRNLLQQRRTDLFSILMTHHPHGFDAAAEAGVPLILCGHTHGGQLMLNEQVGFGPALFRYWSGLYRRGDSQMIVSNGVGNWFPLRTAAPAEIVHITLRRA